jgi:hypothetical protein
MQAVNLKIAHLLCVGHLDVLKMDIVSLGDRAVWEGLEALSDADDCDATESVMSFMDYMESDLQEDARVDVELCKLAQSFGGEQSEAVKRIMCASIASVIIRRKRRRESTLKTVMLMNLHLFETYVKFRGGIEKMMVYEIPNVDFNLESFGDKEVYGYFRFSEGELRRLCTALQIPNVIVTSEGDKCVGLHVLCMMCMYYAYPTRRFEMIAKFGTSMSRMSRLISHLRNWLCEKYYPGMSNPKQLTADKMEEFSGVVEERVGMPGIFSFIDGTVRPTCKPEIFQAVVYNGKDKTHALKYQVVVTPDGMMRHVYGPVCGSRHDQHMVHASKVLQWVTSHGCCATGEPFVCYADAGYALAPGLMRPFADEAINIEHKAFNEVMSSVRICVEWEFGDIVTQWAHVNYKRSQLIANGSRPGQQYIVAALLTNCRNCVRPGQTSKYFKCTPPSLEEYIASLL